MRHKFPSLAGLGLVAATMAFGCQGSGSHAKVVQELGAIKSDLEKINAKLDGLDKAIKEMPAAGPAGKQKPKRPPGPDPKATYKVAVGDAVFKGPADAKITLVEWSDFQ